MQNVQIHGSPFGRDLPYARMVSVPVDTGGRRSVIEIPCDSCDAKVEWSVTSQRHPPSEAVAGKARGQGWALRKKGATCPECQKVSKVAEKLSDPALAPRTPTKADTRAIFRKLDEVYDDRAEVYCDGYTDEVVAKELGMPRKWVEDVRSEHFGPPGNSELLKAMERLRDMETTITDMMNTLMEGAAACERTLAGLNEERAKIGALMREKAK